MKVDFIIVGAQKCGTTTLFDILNSHPMLSGCLEKEPNFFNQPNWKKKIRAYESLFILKDRSKYFEATTNYTFSPHNFNKYIVQDLYSYNPNLKIIYLVRRPVDRIISGYMHGRQIGRIKRDINIEIKENPFFIDVTRYYNQIIPYIDKFGYENVIIIDFDDLIYNQKSVLLDISNFLDIDFCFSAIGSTHKNNSLGILRPHFKYVKLVRMLKKFTNIFPDSFQEFAKKGYQRTSFLIGDNYNTKPILTQTSKDFIFKQLKNDISNLEILMEKSLDHWKG